jgi:XTP/dITP diphosphohydrolase
MRRFTGDQLVVATHNQGKLEEIADLLSPYGITLTSNTDHNLPEP